MAAAVLFGAASCAKEDISSSIANGETVEVTFTANLPELGTRAYGDGTNADVVYVNVYEANSDTLLGDLTFDEGYTVSGKQAKVNIALVKGMKYDIVFWAQYADCNYYRLDGKVVTVNYENATANDNSRDAFYAYVEDFDPIAPNGKDQVKLYRPFAQLNAATLDKQDVVNSGVQFLTKSEVKTYTYTQFNIAEGDVEGNLVEVSFSPTTIPANLDIAEVLPGKENYTYLSMNYLLVNDKELVDATFKFYGKRTEGDTEFLLAENEYSNVPLQRNYRTNILGKLITKSTDFEVEILPGFVGTENVDIWDGKSVSEPSFDPQTNTYTVTNGAELAWVANEVNKYSNYEYPFKDVTIKLASSINLNGAEWTPIGDYRFSANRFCGTFDGQNHTISNFKITKKTDKNDSNKSSYGFFGNVEGTVKNLTIANATVNSYAYTGALVGRLNSGLIENCNVVDCTVSNTYWQGGILIGQVNGGSVKNCTVKNSSITSKSAIGAISGPVTNETDETDEDIVFENCTVENCQINQVGSFGGSYDKYFGTMFGYLEAAEGKRIIINNCTATNTTVKGNSNAMFSGDIDGEIIVNGGLPVSTADELDAALKAGGSYYLTNNIAVTADTYQNVDFTLDGNGYTISQVEGSTNEFALFDSVTGKITLKNIVFDGVKGGAVLRTIGAELTMDNVTAQNGAHTQQQGLFRLMGKSTITNCTFKNNTCSMVITLNYDGANNDPQVVENCVFEGNTCNGTAVLYYVKGASCTLNNNKFVGNTVNCENNGATVYMGFTENNVVTKNLFKNNTVNEAGESSRVAGGIFFGYETEFTGNAFIGNAVTGENAKGNDVCVSTYYTSIDLSGNYWGGYAPVEDDDYFVQHKSDERVVIVNDYLTENPFN